MIPVTKFSSTASFALALLLPLALGAQADAGKAPTPPPPTPSFAHSGWELRTYYLMSPLQVSESADVVTALRNMLDPNVRIYLVSWQNAIELYASPEQQQMAKRMITDLDRPKKAYRVTYTLTELDNGKRIGTSHFSTIVVSGQRSVLKQGSKVPVAIGTLKGQTTEEQYTYLDVGLNIESSADTYGNGVRLRSKVEQSGIAEEKSAISEHDPVVRQTVLEGTSFLTENKPVVLGSVDVPGTTRRFDITVAFEPAQ